jgi:NAD(P)-dependent dehydrogenase (short-subunit alcohol dehydrogenase family)
MLLKDKVIVITGVGPGMGSKLATIAAAEGAKVAISARSEAFLKEVAAEITAQGGQVISVPTDVGDLAQCERLVQQTVKAFGRVDGLVNSAYRVGGFKTFEDASIEEWQANMDITCFGALRMSKAVLPVMKKQKEGSIINVSALASVKPAPGQADYATAKSALNGATRQLAQEFGKYNIRVNSARVGHLWGAPLLGYLKHLEATQHISQQDYIDKVIPSIALNVIPPDEECAKSVLFFVSDYARMVSGATLDVNGGDYMAP